MLIEILYRTIVFYFVVVLILRFSGKREVGELGIIDLVVTLIVADIAVLGIENTENPFWYYVLSILLIGLLERVISYFMLKSLKLRKTLEGKSTILIHNGKINLNKFKSELITIDDLISLARLKDIYTLHEIDVAILETNGDVSFVKKNINFKPYIFPIIVSGGIEHDNLNYLNLNVENVMSKVNHYLDMEIKDVLYATITEDGVVNQILTY